MRRLFATAWTIWLFDFVTKAWALQSLSTEPRKVIGSLLQFTLVYNSGAAFSFATGFTILFSLIALSVVVATIYFAPRITSHGWQLTIGLLLGGVLGNLTDRIFREPSFLSGYVIDWIQIPHWPVFNIADSAICIAAAISFILSMRNIPPITRVR
ncbi:signal peptidase II [Actinobacteria bacterium IMCC25003]|nr:signal peptidase II [Actinobacteria bacterium IMCC25003]